MTTADTLNTFLAALDAHPLLERLFFASAELAMLAVCVALAIALLRIRSPRACAILWLIVLAKPVVTLTFGAVVPVLRLAPPDPIVATAPLLEVQPLRSETMPHVSTPELPPAPLPAPPVQPAAIAIPVRPPINWGALAPRFLASLWLAGVAALLGSTLLDRIRLRRFIARTTSPAAHASAALAEGAASLQLRTTPPLRVTTELESPAVVGWFRSTIVIPQWLNGPENETALAWALRHELTHLKHRDPIANALRRLAQILFFFHPVTWWASRRWEAAVELACDRAVVRTDDDVTAYAEQLYAILVQARQQRQRTMATGLFATRTQINTRIAALLGNSLNTPARLGIAAVLSLVLFAGTVFAVGGAIADREDAKEETAGEETEQSLPSPQAPTLQAKCESLLEGQAGAIVVLNVDTGAVLAMASAPFGTMKEVIEGQEASGNAHPIRPAYTRAYQEQYPPGSTFKILLAAAALEEGVITPDTTHYCGGSYRINGGGRAWGCWQRRGHDRINVTDALVYSCDVFFYNVGLSLGVDKINEWSRKLGLGVSTGIDLPREVSGLIPSQDWKKQIYADKTVSEQKWYPGDTVNLSIGQGRSAVTPLQNAVMMAAIVNGGFRVMPRMNAELPPDRSQRMLSDATLKVLHAALRRTVEKAPPDYPADTGWRAGIDGIDILGKTGSAQIMSAAQWSKYASDEEIPYEMRDHAWFVAGVMDREPKISVSVLLEHGMHGGTGAAEIARAVIAEAYGIETSVREKTVVIDGETVTLTTPEDESQELPTTRSRRSSLEKSTGPAVKERPYMVHLRSGHSQPADAVEEDESFYLLTYDDHTFKIRKALVREVVKVEEDDKGKVAEVPSARTLTFPDDRSLGTLYTHDPMDYAYTSGATTSMHSEEGWTLLGEAQGNVEIPAGKMVRLDVAVLGITPSFSSLPADGIQYLNLRGIGVSGGTLRHIAGWTGLEALSLRRCRVPDVELQHLRPLVNLRWLDLEDAVLQTRDLTPLVVLKQLRHLSLRGVDLSNRAATALPQLGALNIVVPSLNRSPLQCVAELDRLQSLDLSFTGISGDQLGDLTTLTGLLALDLEAAPIVNEDLRYIYPYENLAVLSLKKTRITEGYKAHLAALPNLASVDVDYTAAPDAEHQMITLGGRVVDEDGDPASGVGVLLIGEYGDPVPMGERGISGPDGRWEVPMPTGWTRLKVALSSDHYVSDLLLESRAVPPEAQLRDHTAEFVVKAGVSLSGTVRDSGGDPVAGATIYRDVRELRSKEQGTSVRTDENGKFTFHHLDDTQDQSLTVLSDGHAPEAVALTKNSWNEPLNVTLSAGAVLRGQVIDAAGAPVGGVAVTLGGWWNEIGGSASSRSYSLRTGTDGCFEIPNTPTSGRVQLTFSHENYFDAAMRVKSTPEEALRANLIPKQPFRGRVVDASSGLLVPMSEVELGLRMDGGEFNWISAETAKITRSPDAGDFTIWPNIWLMADRQTEFAARVTAKGYAIATSEPVGGARLGEVITIALQPIDAGGEEGE